MNERIIDIAMDANDQTGNEFDLNYKPLDAFLEKFAELIVRECADVLLHGCEIRNQADEKRYEYGASRIKQHFGVEE